MEGNEGFSLATNFQDLDANVKNLGTISCPFITSFNCIFIGCPDMS